MNKYSFILPVRNGGDYVKECVNSILAQTYTGFNLHILDNNSTDGTVAWIESLQDKRIIVYRSNKSLSIEENWSRIKDIPKNEFMTMIGHDDLVFPGYLQEMDALIKKHPKASLYQTHFNYINETGEFVRPCQPMDEVQYAHEFLACQMCRTLDSTGTGYIMRSADFDAVGGMPAHFPNLIYSDYCLWITLISLGYKATSFKQCFSYRLHLSVSRNTNGMDYQEAFSRYLGFLKEHMQKDQAMQQVMNRYGRQFLLYMCEALSHRLLKTPVEKRNMKVADLIKKYQAFAADLIPGQRFEPLHVPRIKIAMQLDRSAIGRNAFYIFKKLRS